jgi:hypothetical protein
MIAGLCQTRVRESDLMVSLKQPGASLVPLSNGHTSVLAQPGP